MLGLAPLGLRHVLVGVLPQFGVADGRGGARLPGKLHPGRLPARAGARGPRAPPGLRRARPSGLPPLRAPVRAPVGQGRGLRHRQGRSARQGTGRPRRPLRLGLTPGATA